MFPKIVLCSDSMHSKQKIKIFEQKVGIKFDSISRLYGENLTNEDKNIWILKSTYPGIASPMQVSFISFCTR